MHVNVFPYNVIVIGRTTQRVIAERIATTRLILVHRLIHEMIHGAGKNRMYSHQDMDAAAIAADPEVGEIFLNGEYSYFHY
ncbi:hypothetical protein BH20ACI4_BH20ACI4_14240 [soil metagenome]